MKFPFVWVGLLAFAVAATLAAASLSSAHCAFGFGGFQCNGWVGNISGLLFAWTFLAMGLIPVLFIIALWRVVKWARRA